MLPPPPAAPPAPSTALRLRWDDLPALPAASGQARQPGVAGAFAGTSGDALVVAGGANFPDAPPWQGGRKAWSRDVFVLPLGPDGPRQWLANPGHNLPHGIGYGVSVTTPAGVICVGGCDSTQCYRDVFLLTWNPGTQQIARNPLPPLPKPLAFMAGSLAGSWLLLAGGQHSLQDPTPSHDFWALDLSRLRQPDLQWVQLPSWPGPARILPVAAAQSNGLHDCFYLFSGRVPRPGCPALFLTDAYEFNCTTQLWRTLRNVNGDIRGGGDGWSVTAGTAVACDPSTILVIGGDRGGLSRELEALDLEVAAWRKPTATGPEDPAERQHAIDRCLRQKCAMLENHPGFSRELLAYDIPSDTWRLAATPGPLGLVTSPAVPWGKDWIIPGGEIRPGVRTTRTLRLKLD